MNKIKDIHVILVTNRVQIIIIIAIIIVLFGVVVLYVNFRPGFLKIKPVPEQLADLKSEMKDGFEKIFNWQNKQDSINETIKINLQHLPTIFPVTSAHLTKISSRYGVRVNPITGDTVWHKGIDITSKKGTPVYASASGKVIRAQREGGYGNLIEIDSGNGIKTMFGHLNTIMVKQDQIVTQGQQIATVGSTGLSTGYHLHYEILNNNKNMNPIIFY